MKAHYAVVGSPIEHSLSPQIHNHFAASTGEALNYTKVRVEPGEMADFVARFRADGGAGLNVTVPLKLEAFELAQQRNDLAQAAGAVNTLKWDAGESAVHGFNTDGVGLLRDLQERHAAVIADASILLVGAGGAAQGVVLPLLDAGVAKLILVNRTKDKAIALARKFQNHSVSSQVRGCGYAQLNEAAADADFDIVINATSMGLSSSSESDSEAEEMPLSSDIVRGRFCYDMSYGANAIFCRWAQAHDAVKSVDGLGMLVEQAAESFYLWRGVRPDTQSIYLALREAVDG